MKILNSVGIGEDICIDPGTAFTSVYITGRGLVLREPSVVAYNSLNHEIAAVGEEAANMVGRTPKTVKIARPIQGGVVTDARLAGEMFTRFLDKVRKKRLVKPRVMVSIPYGISDVEERAVIDAVMRAGARQVIVVEAPVAAALGAGCDVTIARGLMLLDIGEGKTGMAAISLCNAVAGKSSRIAGHSFTDAVVSFVRRKYNLAIGIETAEEVKKKIGTVTGERHEKIDISGMDIATRLPRKITVSSEETENIFDELIQGIIVLIKDTLDLVPPEVLGDILEDGILLTGGGAKLNGLGQKLRAESGIKIFPAEDMELCTIKGAGIAMEHLDLLPNIAQSYHNI